MKRFLAIVAALLILSFCTTAPKPVPEPTVSKEPSVPKEPQSHRAVGQPMPDMKAFIDENHINTVQSITPYPDGRTLLTLSMYKQGDDGYAIFVGVMAFMKCPNGEGSTVPFGICLMTGLDSGVLLLDNAPTDGIIDEVVYNPVRRKILDDMPTCT